MTLKVKPVDNPENKYWIWEPKYSNKSNLRFIPSEVCNLPSGLTVGVYSLDDARERQIAQLEVPDYKMLKVN